MKIIAKNMSHPLFHKYNGQEAEIIRVYGDAPFKVCLHVKFDDGRELHLSQKDDQFDYDNRFNSVKTTYGPIPSALKRIVK